MDQDNGISLTDLLDRFLNNRKDQASSEVNAAFDKLLESRIHISPALRADAGKSQRALRDFLLDKNDLDENFPRVLQKEDNDFIGGSFGRHSKNRPLDDIDIYFPLEGAGLVYSEAGFRLPYVVLSDQNLNWNPLLGPRWATGSNVSSKKLIAEFAKVLKVRYPQSSVKSNGQAVSVYFSSVAVDSSTGKSLGYDIVPCFALRPQGSSDVVFYLISDGNDGWIRTNPRLDNEISQTLNEAFPKVFRRVVRLLKFWNTDVCGGRFSSYFIELAITKRFWKIYQEGKTVPKLSLGIALGFETLNEAVGNGRLNSWVEGAPVVVPGEYTIFDKAQLMHARDASASAWGEEKQGRGTNAIKDWKKIFGADFGDSE